MPLQYDPNLMMWVNVPAPAAAPAPVAPAPAASGWSPAAMAPPPPAPAPAPFVPPSFNYTPGQALDPAILQAAQQAPSLTGNDNSGWSLPGHVTSDNGYTVAPIMTNDNASAMNGTGQTFAGAGVNDGQQWYQGQNEYSYNPAGTLTNVNPIEDPTKTNWVDQYGPFIPLMMVGGALAAAGAAGGAGAAAGAGADAGAAGAGAGGFLGDATAAGYGGLDAASAASMGGGAGVAGGSALGSLGAAGAGLDTATMGAQAAGSTGASNAAIDTAAANAGSSGTGLTMGGGQLGLTGSTGSGLSLGGGGSLGVTAASPGATAIGDGLSTGFAGGSGSLLGPTALGGLGAAAAGGAAGSAGSAAANAGSAAASGASDAGAAGVPPPANPYDPSSYLNSTNLSNLISSGVSSGLAGPLATLAGGLLGSQANTTSQTKQLPSYLQAPVANDLIPRTQGLLASQMPQAQASGQQMIDKATGLLGAPVAANGVGNVTLNSPTTATNPYLSGMADDMQRRTQMLLGQNNLSIQGNSVASGGLGGSRQGVAQGIAAGQAADSLQGQLAGLYGSAYNNDQNRALQQYGYDQNFYGNQRGQDLAQVGIGSGLATQGLQTQFSPLQSTANVFSPFTGFGTTTASQGGGLQGALGGALGAAQLGSNLGWW